jgi:hypothetical protein
MLILLETFSSWKKNPLGEWLPVLRGELLAPEQEIHRRNDYFAENNQLRNEESARGIIIPPGITRFWMVIPTEEWNIRLNYKFLDSDSGQKINLSEKSSKH